mgnify:CR=1 FL=1
MTGRKQRQDGKYLEVNNCYDVFWVIIWMKIDDNLS